MLKFILYPLSLSFKLNRLPLAEILYHGVQLTLVVRRSAAKYSPVEDAGVFRISVFGPKKYSGIANAASVFRTGN